ncbi:Bystin-domain-containing protein [Nadsonia fulvescens var. elongata DSM 6958]|uniref:Bystin-domain-containing protein n=1 Tax=Nadsonia fulvescens var. elongata DSM 6958 TaxID=857566 RepID=A0A1E3PQ13_9ASCO|nr:Bystin-domain-containing protein [Nadsonia fulvescens var. elongata DSM 6958]
MPKASDSKNGKQRHNPLHVELTQDDGILRSYQKAKKSRKKTDANSGDEGEGFVDAGMSRKILQMARAQKEELEQEEGENEILESGSTGRFAGFEVDEEQISGSFSDEDDDDYEDYEEFDPDAAVEELEVNPEDDALFQKFLGGPGPAGLESPVNLADKILERIREKESTEAMAKKVQDENARGDGVMLPPKVIEVYVKVGELLSRYRSGKLPKAFKIIPSLRNWQDVLYVTNPEGWSTNAVYEATKLFVSNLKSNQSQTFLEAILLDRFRDDIAENKVLNYHIYRSLKKSLYKPAAFFKGFLFPLAESGRCSLREAVIVGSILSKVSIPALHSAAALLRLSEMEYSGPNSLFIKVLIDKKYALPYKVIDSLVFHFLRFRINDGKALPVIWHQSFLVFAQRYKNDVTDDQREALLEVLKTRIHPKITSEIRRELMTGSERPAPASAMEIDA